MQRCVDLTYGKLRMPFKFPVTVLQPKLWQHNLCRNPQQLRSGSEQLSVLQTNPSPFNC